jgi:F420H(2)-dependent quinone reductase
MGGLAKTIEGVAGKILDYAARAAGEGRAQPRGGARAGAAMDFLAGRIARVAPRATCRLTHYGRTTGRAHEVTIWFLPDGNRIYLSTMNMRRHWPRNLLTNPRVVLRIGSERFAGAAHVVTAPAEMAHVIGLLKRKYWLSRVYLWIGKRPDGAFRVELDQAGR